MSTPSLRDSFKDILQELLEAEMDASPWFYSKTTRLGWTQTTNAMGILEKTIKSQFGEFPLDIPRDRNGEFEPKLVPKHQRDVSGIEEKVIAPLRTGHEHKGYP